VCEYSEYGDAGSRRALRLVPWSAEERFRSLVGCIPIACAEGIAGWRRKRAVGRYQLLSCMWGRPFRNRSLRSYPCFPVRSAVRRQELVRLLDCCDGGSTATARTRLCTRSSSASSVSPTQERAENLSKPVVAAKIAEARNKRAERTELTQDWAVDELRKLSTF
jgi:hypothetical protein